MGLYFIWHIFSPLIDYFTDQSHVLYFRVFKRKPIQRILKKVNPFYAKLPIREKYEFELLTWYILRSKHFAERNDFEATLTLKVIISSYAAQIALKLPDESFDYYDKIILYQDYYTSKLTGRLHKAEVNPGLKIIVFSLRAIYESIAQSRDGINVLLHEFAHALRLEHKAMHQEYTIFDNYTLHRFDVLAQAEIELMITSENHIFRKYASTNLDEFFAVAVENFFERPREFYNALPELYQTLARLLNQDTLKLQR
jgi:MtfA peptidase